MRISSPQCKGSVAKRWGIVVMMGLLAAGGCQRDVSRIEEEERRIPDLAAAREALDRGDREGAERRYAELLKRKPNLPLAHLEYARFLDEGGERPLLAIYHYMRYQELRPEAEKNEVISRRVRQLAGEVGGARPLRARLEEAEARIAILEAEKMRLLAEMAVLREKNPVPTVSTSWSATPGRSSTGSATNRFYRVKAGDTLIRIAEAMYGDGGQAIRIFEANRSQLKSMDAIRVGQVLVIPP